LSAYEVPERKVTRGEGVVMVGRLEGEDQNKEKGEREEEKGMLAMGVCVC
jgi:hypothetical protein